MSHSPLSDDRKAVTDQNSPYVQQLARLNDILDRGGSLSGFERNCAFLNLGAQQAGQFATVSNLFGIDFDDDGRGFCASDWDADGDLDLWVVNRTGPRVRFLENQQETKYDFVRLKLIGVTSHRDAIGARVAVNYLSSGKEQVQSKSLKAGEGFLTQSSKFMHFGLGPCDRISKVSVSWPSGKRQLVAGIDKNGSYLIKEDAISAQRLNFNTQPIKLVKFDPPAATEKAQIRLTSRLPMLPVCWDNLEGRRICLQQLRGQAVLVNLWASWCVPCKQELMDLQKIAEQLAERNVVVAALSVDGIESNRRSDDDKTLAAGSMRSLPPKFQTGFVRKESLNVLQSMDDFLFSQKRRLTVPASFLIDERGRLAAIYRGTMSIPRFMEDIERMNLTGKQLYAASLPFPGTWYRPQIRNLPLKLVVAQMNQGNLFGLAEFVLQNTDALSAQKGFAGFTGKLAGKLVATGEFDDAIQLNRVALQHAPENLAIMNNLAWYLATHPDPRKRNSSEAIQIATKAARQSKYRVLPVLDTLARAFVEADEKDKAIPILQQCLRLAESNKDTKSVEKYRNQIEQLSP